MISGAPAIRSMNRARNGSGYRHAGRTRKISAPPWGVWWDGGRPGLGWDANTGAIVARYSSKQQPALMCETIEDMRLTRR